MGISAHPENNVIAENGLNFNVGRTDSLRFGGNIFYSHSDRRATSPHRHAQFLFPDSVGYGNSGAQLYRQRATT